MMYKQCDSQKPHRGHSWGLEGIRPAHYYCHGLSHQPLNQLDLEGKE